MCCDSLGSNKVCEEFIGEDADVHTVDLTGLSIWCNPPYDTPTVRSVLQHIMSHESVRALILLPQWSFDAPVRKMQARAQVLHLFPTGTELYSRAENDGCRSSGWRTRWPVVCWQFVGRAFRSTDTVRQVVPSK